MFKKTVDTNDRNAMITFLSRHFRYNTLNSWNRMTSYANNVKLHNLDIPSELIDKAYDFVYIKNPEYDIDISTIIDDFKKRTGYTIASNGRSNGYLVLYDTDSCRSIDQDEDFEDWGNDELKSRVELVTAFDECCDDIVATFIDHLKRCRIGMVEVRHMEPAVLYD